MYDFVWRPQSCLSDVFSSAVAFKNAKQLEQAKDAYLKEAEAHSSNRAYPKLQERLILHSEIRSTAASDLEFYSDVCKNTYEHILVCSDFWVSRQW